MRMRIPYFRTFAFNIVTILHLPINLSTYSFSFAQHRQKNVIFIHFTNDCATINLS